MAFINNPFKHTLNPCVKLEPIFVQFKQYALKVKKNVSDRPTTIYTYCYLLQLSYIRFRVIPIFWMRFICFKIGTVIEIMLYLMTDQITIAILSARNFPS